MPLAHVGEVARLSFRVYGQPTTQGSSRGRIVRTRDGRTFAAVVPDHARALTVWRGALALAAGTALADSGLHPDLSAPVGLVMDFAFARPRSLPRRCVKMARGYDVDKLARAALDALSGVLYVDDRQIVELHVTKRYTRPEEPAGVAVSCRWLTA